MNAKTLDMYSGPDSGLPPILPGKPILVGENPFIRLGQEPGMAFTTDASLWTLVYSPEGAGHALFIRSELTDNQWRIYSDNPRMVRWLQSTVQGMLNPETATDQIAVIDSNFSRQGNVREGWIQKVHSDAIEITMNWSNFLDPLLMAHDEPTQLPNRSYGASLVMLPALKAELTLNDRKAQGDVWPCKYDGQPFSTACLAFSESWREGVRI